MNTEADFAKYAYDKLRHTMDLLVEKGKEYGANKDALSNFNEGAVALSETPQSYLMNLVNKQHYVLCQWATGHRDNMTNAQVQGRIDDVIIYMLLLSFMLTGHAFPNEQPLDTTELDVHINELSLLAKGHTSYESEMNNIHLITFDEDGAPRTIE